MPLTYNRIAGQSVERLAALSDGVFAVAMTLLVLDLRVPATEAIRNEHDLWHALLALSPRLLMYMMSFLTLGIFWVGQQTQLNHLAARNEVFPGFISHSCSRFHSRRSRPLCWLNFPSTGSPWSPTGSILRCWGVRFTLAGCAPRKAGW